MRSFFTVSIIISVYVSFAQQPIDSLQRVLNNTTPTRENFNYFIERIRKSSPYDTAINKHIFDWIDKHTPADSLADIKSDANLAIGRQYTLIARLEEATKYLTTAQSISEKYGFYVTLSQVLNILGSIYEKGNVYNKAEQYYSEAIRISKQHNYLPGVSKAQYNLGKMHFETSFEKHTNPKQALLEMSDAFKTALHIKDTQSIINQSNGLSAAFTRLKQHDSAIFYINYAASLLNNNASHQHTQLSYYANLGSNYRSKREYKKALEFFNKGLQLAEKHNTPRWLCSYYYGLAETYEDMGDYKNANFYNQQNVKLHDALVKSENFMAAADIQNKYEREKKDNQILKLEIAYGKKSKITSILISITIGLMLIGLLSYINFRKNRLLILQEQELQQHKIIELEKDRQLVAIDAMLKGQEEERSRIAKELHDGLGGLLSGAKYSLTNLKEKIPLSKDNAIGFDHSLDLLNTTISDLRRVAQNLMPDTLSRFGLKEALRDFCDAIHNTTGIQIIFQQFGNKREPEGTPAIFIYRIVQELVNNAVKYAEASEIAVELIVYEQKIDITIEDDGIGFNKDLLLTKSGSGIKNVQYRVDYLSGTFDIDTEPGNGTSVYIQVFV